MTIIVGRSKSKFPSKIKAWRAIEKSGISQSRIIKAVHTVNRWQWRVRSKSQRKRRR